MNIRPKDTGILCQPLDVRHGLALHILMHEVRGGHYRTRGPPEVRDGPE